MVIPATPAGVSYRVMKIIVLRTLLILGGLLLGILGEWQPWFDHASSSGPQSEAAHLLRSF